MEEKPLISIIVTYYNSVKLGDFVRKSMQCLLSQTYQNIEFICVNDGSTDDTLDQLRHYSTKDARVRVYSKENEKYAQYSKAYGQDQASGEYIFLLDHDDLIEGKLIEKCYDQFLTDPDLDIVTPIVQTIFTDGTIKYVANLDYYSLTRNDFVFRKISGREALKRTVGRYDIHIRGLYRAELFKSISFRFTEALLNADEIVERLIFEKARYIGSCDAVYTHFIHPDSSAKLPSLKKIDIVRTDVLLRSMFREKNVYDERKGIFELTAYKNFVNGLKTFHHFSRTMHAEQRATLYSRLQESFLKLDKSVIVKQFNGLSKFYNAILMISFDVIFLFYKLKK